MKQSDWKRNLIAGYQEFRAGSFKTHKDLYEKVGVDGQAPDVMIIACSDSRVNPSSVFNAYPGELFTLRNVANIVPPYDPSTGFHGTSAAIEFAVKVLKVDAIMVMGHENCGGVSAYLASKDANSKEENEHSFMDSWIQILDNAHARLVATDIETADNHRCMEYAGVRQSLANLMSFPFVEKAVASGQLTLLGAYFSIIDGRLLFANKYGIFEDVPTKSH